MEIIHKTEKKERRNIINIKISTKKGSEHIPLLIHPIVDTAQESTKQKQIK
jgi:hypothetical protein